MITFLSSNQAQINQGRFKSTFTHCFDLTYRHKFACKENSELIRRSWSDDLLSDTFPDNEDDYWWEQKLSIAYPVFSNHPECSKTKQMTEITGHQMFYVKLDAEHFVIDFVFYNFKYEFLDINNL